MHQHLVPALGHYRLSQLRPQHIQRYYAQELVDGRKRGKSCGLTPQTVLHHHRVLRAALQQAVRWQLLVRNPADAVAPPHPGHREMSALDESQTANLLWAAQGSQLYAPILVAVTTGLRRGELLGLRWHDLDFERGTLAVRQAVE